jgi:hypothetical protein
MIRMKVTANHTAFTRGLQAEASKLARMARRAANELAWLAVEDIRQDMRRAFHMPTEYVQNSLTVVLARGEESNATIDWIEGYAKRNSGPGSRRVLRAQIEGGQRRHKSFEKKLGLPADIIAVPGKHAEIDRHGNLDPGMLTKILSYLKLFPEVGYRMNRGSRGGKSRRQRKNEKYFIVAAGGRDAGQPWSEFKAGAGGLPPGVYRYDGAGARPRMVIAFVSAATYRPRFNPARVVRDSIPRHRAAVWRQAIEGRIPDRTALGNVRG